MQMHRLNRPTPRLHIPDRKHVEFDSSTSLTGGGNLSPDLSPNSPPVFPQNGPLSNIPGQGASKIGRYILTTLLDTQGHVQIYKAFQADTHEEYMCKVIPLDKYNDSVSPYWRIGSHNHINEIEEIILGETQAYVFFGHHYGDLHTYVRTRKRLRESEVCRLYTQIVLAVTECHENGVVLRDLKLRKFVFKDPERTQLKLVGLEDAHILSDDKDDSMVDKHGCPAYVSPEILNPNKSYSGKAADIWSIGVMLYTMLVGRYPFHDREPSTLFMKIRRGDFTIPDYISSRAKCLLRSLLRRKPEERLEACEILQHPWFNNSARSYGTLKLDSKAKDQMVPNINIEETDNFFV